MMRLSVCAGHQLSDRIWDIDLHEQCMRVDCNGMTVTDNFSIELLAGKSAYLSVAFCHRRSARCKSPGL